MTCQRGLGVQEEVQEFALMIEEEYRSHFLVDNLPVAMSVFHETDEGTTSLALRIESICGVSSP